MDDGEWKLMNVGGSTANQVRFAEQDSSPEIWIRATMSYSIPAGVALNIHSTIQFARALSAIYLDSSDRRYLVVCRGDTNTVWEEGEPGWNQALYNHHHNEPARQGRLKMVRL